MVHVCGAVSRRLPSALVGTRGSQHTHHLPVLVWYPHRLHRVWQPLAGASPELLCKHRSVFSVDVAVLTGVAVLEGLANASFGCWGCSTASDPVVNLCLYCARSYFTSSTP
jgi:hypothetical protein